MCEIISIDLKDMIPDIVRAYVYDNLHPCAIKTYIMEYDQKSNNHEAALTAAIVNQAVIEALQEKLDKLKQELEYK